MKTRNYLLPVLSGLLIICAWMIGYSTSNGGCQSAACSDECTTSQKWAGLIMSPSGGTAGRCWAYAQKICFTPGAGNCSTSTIGGSCQNTVNNMTFDINDTSGFDCSKDVSLTGKSTTTSCGSFQKTSMGNFNTKCVKNSS